MLFSLTLPIVSALLVYGVPSSECRTYHLSFLGRNSITPTIGSVVATSVNTGYPNITISRGLPECEDIVSNVTGVRTTVVTLNYNVSANCSTPVPNNTNISQSGIRIETDTSSNEIHVYQTDSNGLLGDGFLAIPDDFLGKAYYVNTYCSLGGFCQFAITAVYDNTAVNIVFPRNVTSHLTCYNGFPIPDTAPSGTNVPIVLHEFQVLHVESNEDLSGTYIVANKIISVIVGARDVPNEAYGNTNMIEQIPPVNRWGTEFVVTPNYFNNAGDLIKIVSKVDNTVVHIQGVSPFTMSRKGDVYERRIEWELHSRVLTSHPVLIMQIMSVDLYNDSTNVYGSPSMVMVPHIHQWTDAMLYYCFDTVVTMVAESSTCTQIPVIPIPSSYHPSSTWSDIPGSKYSKLTFISQTLETEIYGPRRAAYAQCNKRASLLLAADWNYENKECEVTAASPGDGRDNNCDGDIDEHTCQPYIVFVAEQNTSGNVTYKTINIKGVNSLHFRVQTCHLALIKLQSTLNPEHDVTLKISSTGIRSLHTLIPFHNGMNCSVKHDYFLEWKNEFDALVYTLTIDTVSITTWNETFSTIGHYDEVIMSAMVGTAGFELLVKRLRDVFTAVNGNKCVIAESQVDPALTCIETCTVYYTDLHEPLSYIYEADCKFNTDSPDDFGSHFVIPVKNTDNDFSIFILNGHEPCTVEFSVSLEPVILSGNGTQTIYKYQLNSTQYSTGIVLTSLECEVAVYLFREELPTYSTFLRILPTDVLSTKYLLYSGADVAVDQNTLVCEVWPVYKHFVISSDVFNITYEDVGAVSYYHYQDLAIQHRLETDHVVAVFCGTFNDTLIQMPPLSYLGILFNIPKLDLVLLNADASIYLIASEDSTVITIKGDYDQMDPIFLTGDDYTRPIANDTIYSIQSTKPVQVHLQIRSVLDEWASVINIPPTSQYKTEHVFPEFFSQYSITLSTGIDEHGNNQMSQIDQSNLPVGFGATLQMVYSVPTFTLTFVKNQTVNNSKKQLVFASDTAYNETNEECVITHGLPGDFIDNDCDGLTDEENCTDILHSGYIDIDIDGSLYEDCTANSDIPTTVPQSMPSDVPKCVSNYTQSSHDVVVLTIAGTNTVNSVNVPTTPGLDPDPTYAPVEPLGENVILMTTAPPSPGESCTTECVCPCGWVHTPQNYTVEELKEVVDLIQEKLVVSKAQLSSTIRKKTSAPDNRSSAVAVGSVGLVFILLSIGLIVFLDVTTLVREIKMFFTRVREISRSQ